MEAWHSAQVYPGVPAPMSQAWGSPDSCGVLLCEVVRAVVTAAAEHVRKDWNVEAVAGREVWVTVRGQASTPDCRVR